MSQYKQGKIDIVLLTFNRRKILQRTLESIWARTKTPYRLIIVDNNSNDGTVKWLRNKKKQGMIDELVEITEPQGLCHAYNEGFKLVRSKYFITTQDDILPPDLKPDWFIQMKDLLDRHSEYGAIAMRVGRMINIKFRGEHEICDARRSCCAYFRIHKKSVVAKNNPYPFGERRGLTDDIEFKKLMQRIGLKAGFSKFIWANHIGHSQVENKGYGKFTNYLGYNKARNDAKIRKPYPKINPKTNVPI